LRILFSLSLLSVLLLSGYPVFGMLFEIFGILNLFGSVACRSLVDGAFRGCCLAHDVQAYCSGVG
jgi:hypothetical protein